MTRIVTVANLKGGIGKTTTVINIGAGLALRGVKVLLVDTDPQGNLSASLGVTARHTLYELLIEAMEPAKVIVPARHNLDIVVADTTLLMAQTTMSRGSDWGNTLGKALKQVEDYYDLILIDSSGSLTPMNANALVAAHDIIAPTTVEPFSVRGLELLHQQLRFMKDSTDAIRLIVPTMYDPRSRQALELLETLHHTYGSKVTQPIRVNVKLSESPMHAKSIFEYDNESRGAEDYRILCDRIIETLQLSPTGDARPNIQQRLKPTSVAEGGVSISAGAAASRQQPVYELQVCPRCGRDVRYTSAAGYRIMICNSCGYSKQMLNRNR
ncbi:MAG: hypothetical protein RLZZ297_1940 [Chloroflexota bacterium]|jgi:chromosome partitioning protein